MAYPVAQPDPTSVVGRRVVAVLIDALIVIVPAILLLTSSFEYLEESDLPVDGSDYCEQYIDEIGGQCYFVGERVYFDDSVNAGSTAYYWGANILLLVVLQGLTGWTPGKLITGLRVVKEDGGSPGIGKAALRWILWLADGFPYIIPGLTGFIVALSTPGHRRVGDLAAHTIVVKRAAAGTPIRVEDGGRLVVGDAPPPPASAGWAPAPVAPPPGAATDPSAAGWASPSGVPDAAAPLPPAAPVAPTPAPSAEGPQWDPARGTYIQWDPTQQAWMQWDEGFKAWTRIPGQ
jgi:uncharacterized RDD family membrane protein YckC